MIADLNVTLRKPVCAAVALALGALLDMAPTLAATVSVTSCADDGGAGTLRALVAGAASGDTVDLSACANSVVTLTQGAIVFHGSNLTLSNSGKGAAAISGNNHSPVLLHYAGTSGGTLILESLLIENGYNTANEYGGCVYSTGNVTLSSTTVSGCTASGYGARGGGVYAARSVSLFSSTITGNTAESTGTKILGNVMGGGISARGGVFAKYSSVINNHAISNYGQALGGGIYANEITGTTTFTNSTISENSAIVPYGSQNSALGGGLYVKQGSSTLTISNSTISDNKAESNGGGLWLNLTGTNASFYNNTIAFNNAAYFQSNCGGACLNGSASAEFESTIVSNNTTGSYNSVHPSDLVIAPNVNLSGFNNLVMTSNGTIPFAFINTTLDPMLGPLQNNGGTTLTRALSSAKSPAIGAGNNKKGATFDQRGNGYRRTTGVDHDLSIDIGAVQFDPSIFANGFE